MLAARAYSGSARNPVASSDHPLEHQTVVGQGVEVARQRAMQEADVHTELDLFVGLRLVEVRADGQYCSGGSSTWWSIQPLPGVWSKGG